MMSGNWMDQDAFRDFCAKLAAELGMELDQTRQWNWCAFLIPYAGDGGCLSGQIPEGLGYSLTRPRGNAMTEVSACYPPTSYPHIDTSPIRRSVARGPHVVAAEIKRHLEPGYLATLAAIAEHDAQEARLKVRRADLADRITGMFRPGKVTAPAHCQTGDTTRLLIHGGGLGGGEVRFSRGAVEVELNQLRVPADVAVAMLAQFAEAVTARRRPASKPVRHVSPGGDQPGRAPHAHGGGPRRPAFPVRCPDWPQPGNPKLMGCGSADLEGPDREGWYDCRTCGLYFEPEQSPEAGG
jgi:hypothetical protein